MTRSDKPEKLTAAKSTASYPRCRALLAGLGAAVLATSLGACTSDSGSTDARPIDANYVNDGVPPIDAHPVDAEIDAPLPDAATPATDAGPGGKR